MQSRAFLIALAAAGCGTVDLGPSPADVAACRPSQDYFVTQVWPNFLAKSYGGKHCYDSNCHDTASGQEMVLTPPTSAGTVPLAPDWAAVYKAVTQQLLCTNVSSSRLLTRPDGRQPHGGGKLIEPDGPEATLIKMWVTAQ